MNTLENWCDCSLCVKERESLWNADVWTRSLATVGLPGSATLETLPLIGVERTGAMATRSQASAMCGYGHYKAHQDVFWSNHTTRSQTQYKLHQQQQIPAKWPEELSVTSADTNYSSSHPPGAVTAYQLHIFSSVSRRWDLFITWSAASRTHSDVYQLKPEVLNVSMSLLCFKRSRNWERYSKDAVFILFPIKPTTEEQLWILGKNLLGSQDSHSG